MTYLETIFNLSAPAHILSDARDVLAALAGEAGYDTFEETPTGLKGYVEQSLYSAEALDAMLQDFPFDEATITYETHEAENRDWNEAWEQQGFEPIAVGTQCVVHDGCHLPTFDAPVTVEIHARQAFGTGTHHTTQMVLAQLLALPLQGSTLIDAGCGTGILGIAALKAGAAHVLAYDIDEWSTDNARHNAEVNQIAPGRYEVVKGDSSVLATAPACDILVANIFREILIADMPRFARALKPHGRLILSGFYTGDIPSVEAAAAREGLTLQAQASQDSWVCLVFGR